MKIRIKVLSPVHIGSGNTISPIEYFVKNGVFYRVDMEGLFSDKDFQQFQTQFINISLQNRKISEIFGNKYDFLMRHILYSLNISQSAIGANLIEIKEIIKTAGRAYIPGSSIKGSILSGVIEHILSQKNIQDLNNLRNHLSIVLNEITNSSQNEFSRWIDIRDTNLLPINSVCEISQAKLIGARTKREMPILYETIKPGSEFETEIFWRAKSTNYNEKTNLRIADSFYRKIYQKEKEYNRVRQILPSIPSDSYILRIGQGSTAWATSFLILAEELRMKSYQIKRPKQHGAVKGPPITRKLISGSFSMGWIAIQEI